MTTATSDEHAFRQTMSGLETALRVEHVATPMTASNGSESLASVLDWASAASFNNVPVQEDGRIVGVIENILGDSPTWPQPTGESTARRGMRALAGDMLIEGREPLAGLIDALVPAPNYRLVVRGGSLDAIVTPSDLGKLPMRVLAFAMVAHLEATMLTAIRSRFATEEDAVGKLGADGAEQVLSTLGDLHDKGLDPSLLEVASLKQKGVILAEAGVFSGDPKTITDEFADLYGELRNPLMHASKFVDDSLAALQELRRRLELIRLRTTEAARATRSGARPMRPT